MLIYTTWQWHSLNEYYVTNSQSINGNPPISLQPGMSYLVYASFAINPTTVVLISGSNYSINGVMNRMLFENRAGKLDVLWPGLPDDSDAAVELNQTNVIFFKCSYHYMAKINGGPVTVTLTMNRLHQCTDVFYAYYTTFKKSNSTFMAVEEVLLKSMGLN